MPSKYSDTYFFSLACWRARPVLSQACPERSRRVEGAGVRVDLDFRMEKTHA